MCIVNGVSSKLGGGINSYISTLLTSYDNCQTFFIIALFIKTKTKHATVPKAIPIFAPVDTTKKRRYT